MVTQIVHQMPPINKRLIDFFEIPATGSEAAPHYVIRNMVPALLDTPRNALERILDRGQSSSPEPHPTFPRRIDQRTNQLLHICYTTLSLRSFSDCFLAVTPLGTGTEIHVWLVRFRPWAQRFLGSMRRVEVGGFARAISCCDRCARGIGRVDQCIYAN